MVISDAMRHLKVLEMAANPDVPMLVDISTICDGGFQCGTFLRRGSGTRCAIVNAVPKRYHAEPWSSCAASISVYVDGKRELVIKPSSESSSASNVTLYDVCRVSADGTTVTRMVGSRKPEETAQFLDFLVGGKAVLAYDFEIRFASRIGRIDQDHHLTFKDALLKMTDHKGDAMTSLTCADTLVRFLGVSMFDDDCDLTAHVVLNDDVKENAFHVVGGCEFAFPADGNSEDMLRITMLTK